MSERHFDSQRDRDELDAHLTRSEPDDDFDNGFPEPGTRVEFRTYDGIGDVEVAEGVVNGRTIAGGPPDDASYIPVWVPAISSTIYVHENNYLGPVEK